MRTYAALLLVMLAGVALAQPAPEPPPCQTIFLPGGRMIICCTTGTVTTCF